MDKPETPRPPTTSETDRGWRGDEREIDEAPPAAERDDPAPPDDHSDG